MKNNYFIIHGSYGNPNKNWIPWLRNEIVKRGHKCTIPHFPTPEEQEYSTWEKLLKYYLEIGYIGENTTFIAHSVAGIFVVKFVIENRIKIDKLISVAGFNNYKFNDENDIYNSFYLDNIDKFKKYCTKTYCLYSDNDPYVSNEIAEQFARDIDAEKIEIKGAGHFNDKAGYKEFKEILKYIS